MKINMNRREFFNCTAGLSLALGTQTSKLALAATAEPYENSLPDMLASYFAKEVNALAAEWDRKREMLRTAPDIETRNRFVRQKFIEMIGGFPERTPLSPKIVKVTERPGYRIENLMFQSRPDLWVTGNLWIPTSGAGPRPAIISPCGHYPLARMVPQYQTAYLSLVKNGFIVLAYDPPGQGERRHYWNPETDVSEVLSPTYEHSMPGQLLLLMGENLTQYMVWDGMRAIDYLLTRPEVDGARIGCTGHSGGGTLTHYITVADERVKCAVVHEGGTQNRWPMQAGPGGRLGPSDVEQNYFPAAIYGIDKIDLHVAIAPRPVLTTIEHHNGRFDSAVEQIRARYKQLGVPEKFDAVASDDPHAWTYKLRLATVDWFSRWFLGKPGPASEPELIPEKPRDLYCTPNGSIRYSQVGDTIWSRIQKKASQLPPSGSVSTGTIREMLRYRKAENALAPREVAIVPRKGLRIEKLEFLSEPDIYIPVWAFVPEKRAAGSSAIIYVNEAGKDSDGMEFEGSEASGLRPGFLEALALRGNLVIAADLRGIGETRPSYSPGSSGNPFQHLFNVETALAYLAWYMDRSLFGMRVQDLVRTVDYTLSRPDAGARTVRVIGKDMGALWALLAAALDPRIVATVCHGGLVSYRSLTDGDRYVHGADIFIPDVLEHFDLPQVAAAISTRRLALLGPVDAMRRHVDIAHARGLYSAATVEAIDAHQDLAGQYLRLLGEA
jgi:cephalosporin-C deacetylase-like acetyl esterase